MPLPPAGDGARRRGDSSELNMQFGFALPPLVDGGVESLHAGSLRIFALASSSRGRRARGGRDPWRAMATCMGTSHWESPKGARRSAHHTLATPLACSSPCSVNRTVVPRTSTSQARQCLRRAQRAARSSARLVMKIGHFTAICPRNRLFLPCMQQCRRPKLCANLPITVSWV